MFMFLMYFSIIVLTLKLTFTVLQDKREMLKKKNKIELQKVEKSVWQK